MANQKDIKEIIKNIKDGMTGDREKDMAYLNEMAEKYQHEKDGELILKEISGLMYDLLPEEEKDRVKTTLNQEGSKLQLAVQAAIYHMKNKQYLKAQELLQKEIRQHEKQYPYHNTDTEDYLNIAEPFDKTLHSFYRKDKKLHAVEVPFALAYYTYGLIMEELNQKEAARRALDHALRWSPFAAQVHLKRAELISEELDEIALLEGSKTALLYAYKPELVAHCHANFGKYYMKQEKYELAIGCFMVCQQFEENNEDAMACLKEIYERTEGKVLPPDMDRLKELAAEEDLVLGANGDVVGLAYTYGRHFFNEKQDEPTRYFLEIAYGLTNDKEVLKVLNSIKERRA